MPTPAIEAVERALALPERWPIIVVDDASDDATTQRLHRRFGDDITVITLDRNVGAAARNVGVAAAATPLVAFVDDDSWWEPGSLGAPPRCSPAIAWSDWSPPTSSWNRVAAPIP